MKVFHGSDVRIEKIDLAKSGEFKDFGRGFYVTNIPKHAHKRALAIAAEHGTKPVVTEFEYIEAYPVTMNMTIKRFDTVSEEWVKFVIMNRDRNLRHPAHACDIVEGPIADDWVTAQIERYQKGKIAVGLLIERLTFREQTHQICFCTPESLWALEFVEDDARFDIEDIGNAIVEALAVDRNMDEQKAFHVLLNSKTYEQLANSDTKMYTCSWTDIYSMLIQEIDDDKK
ncbi:MAG: DUF3990 domain-containing protein [Planctomycetaceae bacterium]|jgi:hypothetical protein|nr:DUF3990 domain-containing protein [Planctomycetaceae bacterium]